MTAYQNLGNNFMKTDPFICDETIVNVVYMQPAQ